MAPATVGAPKPRKRKARSVLADVRASTEFVNHDSNALTATALRLQLLSDRFGLSPDRSVLIAALAFGEAAHG